MPGGAGQLSLGAMPPRTFRFDRFLLDEGDRRLLRDGAPIELNGRYLDALALLVREAGRLVPKERFMAEVWRGVPVTDEALTQCIRTLRRQLGDSAGSPRFIETVPKHGYRFVADVEDGVEGEPAADVSRGSPKRGGRDYLLLAGAGTVGGGIAGLIGGLFYGFGAAAQPLAPGMGAASVLLVVLCLTILVALLGGAGVSLGMAAAAAISKNLWRWSVAGAAAGGLAVGGIVELLGLDAFNLLLGRAPGDITGAGEGLLIGAAVGLGAWLAGRGPGPVALRRSMLVAAGIGGTAGLVIPLLGGRLMGGSLDLLARHFPGSRLRLDRIGEMFGESGFGPVSQSVTGALEGALFAGCVVGAMIVALRGMEPRG